MNSLLKAARQYKELGFSVIATDALKQSLVRWSLFQNKMATAHQLTSMFLSPAASCIAIVTGNVSGNLEVIDIDAKNDLNGHLFERLVKQIHKQDGALIRKLVIAQSRSAGYHLYYRCIESGRNQILARRSATKEEQLRNANDKIKVLIETRGEGGYIIVPPSPGYRFIQHDFSRIPVLTATERNILLASARFFNQHVEKAYIPHRQRDRSMGELSPLDDYNQRGDVIGLLQQHGWIKVRQTEQRTFLRRPGDTDKRSSGDYNHEMGLFSVFTTSSPFEPGRGYRPYAVYAILECKGDFKETVKRLAKEGYGHYPSSKQSPYRHR